MLHVLVVNQIMMVPNRCRVGGKKFQGERGSSMMVSRRNLCGGPWRCGGGGRWWWCWWWWCGGGDGGKRGLGAACWTLQDCSFFPAWQCRCHTRLGGVDNGGDGGREGEGGARSRR